MPTYPYISGQSGLVTVFTQLRNSFPSKVDAGYLQRFNIAPSNESYVIAILKFLGLVDEEGNRVGDKTEYFFSNDEVFKTGFEATLRNAYSSLFEEMGDEALGAGKDDLAHWFRGSDKTSDLVGQRQANTFQTLAKVSGHGELPAVRANGAAKKTAMPPGTAAAAKKTTAKKTAMKATDTSGGGGGVHVNNGPDVGLTVRIEVNLPPGGDADTYDAIFASIKKHLMS